MTITGIIDRIGEPRTFEVPTTTGSKKQMVAREIIIISGNNTFVADAYDSKADLFNGDYLRQSDPVIAELRFDERSIKSKDGCEFSQQQVTVVAVQPCFNNDNPKAF